MIDFPLLIINENKTKPPTIPIIPMTISVYVGLTINMAPIHCTPIIEIRMRVTTLGERMLIIFEPNGAPNMTKGMDTNQY